MKKALCSLAAAVLVSSCATANTSLEKVAPYPKAASGMVRHVIELPEKQNENDFMVEIVIGKKLDVDCNRHALAGLLEKKNVDGYGYDYYEMKELKGPISTMMACPNQGKTKKFVVTNLGQESLIGYNSKLPVVVYVPKNVDVKYRVWAVDQQIGQSVIK